MENLSTNISFELFSSPLANLSFDEKIFIFTLSILLFLVLLIGLIGNVLVIYVVLNYGRLKTVTNTYLLHLALSDLIFLSGIPFFISSILTRTWIFGEYICKIFFLSQGVNQYTSIIILALLSFDRYLAVCYSSKSITWRSRVNPNVLLVFIWIFSFILMLPIIIYTTLQEIQATEVQCMIILPFIQTRSLYLTYVIYTLTITFLIPISLMIYFHIKIVIRLQTKIPRHHRRSRTSMRTRRKVTTLVLTVITVHLICCLPYWTFQVFATSELFPQTSNLLIPTSSLTQFLLFVNSSTNPILYAFISEVFWQSFKRVCSCCLRNHNQTFVQETTMIKRNLISTKEQQNHFQQENTILIKDRSTYSNQRYLSVQTDIQVINRQKRLSSLPPPPSIFVSETSVISDN